MIFGGFPRTGIPRVFACYAEYVEAIDALIALGALPDATFLWWDVRLQPALGTVEVRVMDGQSSVAESAPLIALVQSLARQELESEPCGTRMDPEVLAENRFVAARDGLDAGLIDPAQRRIVPVRTLLGELLAELRPHAAAIGCSTELEHVRRLAAVNGANRQRTGFLKGRSPLPGLDALRAAHRAAKACVPLHQSIWKERPNVSLACLHRFTDIAGQSSIRPGALAD